MVHNKRGKEAARDARSHLLSKRSRYKQDYGRSFCSVLNKDRWRCQSAPQCTLRPLKSLSTGEPESKGGTNRQRPHSIRNSAASGCSPSFTWNRKQLLPPASSTTNQHSLHSILPSRHLPRLLRLATLQLLISISRIDFEQELYHWKIQNLWVEDYCCLNEWKTATMSGKLFT
jgi:hypothetical protein